MKSTRILYRAEGLAYPLQLERNAYSYVVRYGEQVAGGLDREQAAHEFGECLFHALECGGKLDRLSRKLATA